MLLFVCESKEALSHQKIPAKFSLNPSFTSHIQRARTTILLDFKIKPLGPNFAVFLQEKSLWLSVHHHVQYPRQAIKNTKQFKTKAQVIKVQYTFEIQAKYLLL